MKQILLLEDLPEIRAWLKTLALQVFPDAQISEASRIHDALELVSAMRFDVAMVDLGLPDGSGVEVVQALREKQPDVQSVVVTIHDDDDHLFLPEATDQPTWLGRAERVQPLGEARRGAERRHRVEHRALAEQHLEAGVARLHVDVVAHAQASGVPLGGV